MKLVGKVARLTRADMSLLFSAFWQTALSSARLHWFGFDRERASQPALGPAQSGISVERITWAVQRVKTLIPGTNCLVIALSTVALLRKSGYDCVLRIGVSKSTENALGAAHAWVETNENVVIGGEDAPRRYKQFPAL